MATKNYKIQQKKENGDMLTLHPETDASAVIMASPSGLGAVAANTVEAVVKRIWEVEKSTGDDLQNLVIDRIGKPKNTTTDTPGIATLDSSGKVPSEQLPSYVDDVLEYANKSAFPAASKAERGKIYIALDTGFTYRWSGSAWVELSSPIKFGTTAGTAYEGSAGQANRNDINAILNGSKTVGQAKTLDHSIELSISQSDDIMGCSTDFDGSDATITLPGLQLTNTGVAAGTYSAVSVNTKVRVTAGAQLIEVGSDNQATPSASLAIGGIFFKKI